MKMATKWYWVAKHEVSISAMPRANKGYSFKPLSENVSRNLSNKNLTPKQEKKENNNKKHTPPKKTQQP